MDTISSPHSQNMYSIGCISYHSISQTMWKREKSYRGEKPQFLHVYLFLLIQFVLKNHFLYCVGIGTLVFPLYISIVVNHGSQIALLRICENFMVALYSIIFNQLAPRLSKEARETINIIEDWYIQEYFTYIRDFGASSAPYLLPQYVLYILVLR